MCMTSLDFNQVLCMRSTNLGTNRLSGDDVPSEFMRKLGHEDTQKADCRNGNVTVFSDYYLLICMGL